MNITDNVDLTSIEAEGNELTGTVSIETALSYHLADYKNWQNGGFQKIFNLLDEDSKVRVLYAFYMFSFEKSYELKQPVSRNATVEEIKAMIKEEILDLALENGSTFREVFRSFIVKNKEENEAWDRLERCLEKTIYETNATVLKQKNNCSWKLKQFNLPLNMEDIEPFIKKVVPLDSQVLVKNFNLNTFTKAHLWNWYESGMGINRKEEWMNDCANNCFISACSEDENGAMRDVLLVLGFSPILKLSVMAAHSTVPEKEKKFAKMLIDIMKNPMIVNAHLFTIPSAIKYYVDNLRKENVQDIENSSFLKVLSLKKWSKWGFREKFSEKQLEIKVVPRFIYGLSRVMELNRIKNIGLDLPSTLFEQDMSNIKGHLAGEEEKRPFIFLDKLIGVMKRENMDVSLEYKMDSLNNNYSILINSPNKQILNQVRDVLVKFFWLGEPEDKLLEEIVVGETDRLMRKDLEDCDNNILNTSSVKTNTRKF